MSRNVYALPGHGGGRAGSDRELEGPAPNLRASAAELRAALPPGPTRREPPKDAGKRLATIPRGEDEQVRVTWAEYEGRFFLSVRLWRRNSDGDWWPQKDKGITIRVRELADFAEGVAAALEEAKRGSR